MSKFLRGEKREVAVAEAKALLKSDPCPEFVINDDAKVEEIDGVLWVQGWFELLPEAKTGD